jgi:hypothetical protein
MLYVVSFDREVEMTLFATTTTAHLMARSAAEVRMHE